MTKLDEIIDAATGETVSAASLLRMVKVVAARLETEQLADWVDRELGGYATDDDLPAYRGPFPAHVMGVFVGSCNSTMTRAVPSRAMPAGLRGGFAYKVAFHQAISELEPLSQSEQALQNPWDANIVARVNHLIDEGNVTLVPMHHLATAYKVVTPHEIRAVVDGVRTRVLNLALDLEKIAPDAGGRRPHQSTPSRSGT